MDKKYAIRVNDMKAGMTLYIPDDVGEMIEYKLILVLLLLSRLKNSLSHQHDDDIILIIINVSKNVVYHISHCSR